MGLWVQPLAKAEVSVRRLPISHRKCPQNTVLDTKARVPDRSNLVTPMAVSAIGGNCYLYHLGTKPTLSFILAFPLLTVGGRNLPAAKSVHTG